MLRPGFASTWPPHTTRFLDLFILLDTADRSAARIPCCQALLRQVVVAAEVVPVAQREVAAEVAPVAQQVVAAAEVVPVAQQVVAAAEVVPVAQQKVAVAAEVVPVAQQVVAAAEVVPVAQQKVAVAAEVAPVAQQVVAAAAVVPVAQQKVAVAAVVVRQEVALPIPPRERVVLAPASAVTGSLAAPSVSAEVPASAGSLMVSAVLASAPQSTAVVVARCRWGWWAMGLGRSSSRPARLRWATGSQPAVLFWAAAGPLLYQAAAVRAAWFRRWLARRQEVARPALRASEKARSKAKVAPQVGRLWGLQVGKVKAPATACQRELLGPPRVAAPAVGCA
jgi:hypothetical protein